jgi:hypothetical protein
MKINRFFEVGIFESSAKLKHDLSSIKVKRKDMVCSISK